MRADTGGSGGDGGADGGGAARKNPRQGKVATAGEDLSSPSVCQVFACTDKSHAMAMHYACEVKQCININNGQVSIHSFVKLTFIHVGACSSYSATKQHAAMNA